MNLKYQTDQFFKDFDNEYSEIKDKLGIFYQGGQIFVNLWQPLARLVSLVIYDKNDQNKKIDEILLSKDNNIWTTQISDDFDGYYYQFKIHHLNDEITYALDPYAYSMAPFNWEGDETKVGKAAFVNLDSALAGEKPKVLITKTNNIMDPYVYELHVRDFTSLLNPNDFQSRLGTFNALTEAKIFDHLNDLNITHLQLLPLQATYTVNEFETKIYHKGEGQKWLTNYNWGYDPHNYFTINGIYSSNPSDPYARIREFRNFVNEAHKNNIAVIVDVVYNHMMTNNIFDNILDGYYYRDNAKVTPVNLPPLADERVMVRRLIIDSLKHLVTEYGVDGFRFDLSCFLHKETIDEVHKELIKIHPNIVLHGEAWPFSDLDFNKSYIKGTVDNKLNFAYFNDTIRNTIKGGEEGTDQGLIVKNNPEYFNNYLISILGNRKDFNFKNLPHVQTPYELFSSDFGMNLAYSHCHDGMTLWDRINTSSTDLSFHERLERYRQGVLMSVATFGRQFMLAGTELLQSKPMDISGMEEHRGFKSNYKDDFNELPDNNEYQSNSYKTTDYTNGLKWEHLKNKDVKKYVYNFVKELNKFRNETVFFKAKNLEKLENKFKFKVVDVEKGIIIFTIQKGTDKIIVAHNFGDNDYDFKFKDIYKVLFNTKLDNKLINNKKLAKHSSVILMKG
ncbi:alpha-amylase family glycosyl hydrolase [Mycoplasma hafezii]|uniref:alpha-amylase family glycosyl hydrolase n=1 Tax=Mycoplasma hafezii TaxID=525886 RepID=UPI003CFB259D